MAHHEAQCLARAISQIVRSAFAEDPDAGFLQIAIHVDGSIAVSASPAETAGQDGQARGLPFYRLSAGVHSSWLFENLVQHIVAHHDGGVSAFYPPGRDARLIVVLPSTSTAAPRIPIPVRLP